MSDFKQRLALHNAQVELEALRAEGRGMLWDNEQRMLASAPPAYGETSFNALAARIRECKVSISDAVTLEGIRST